MATSDLPLAPESVSEDMAAQFDEQIKQRSAISSSIISRAWEDDNFKAELLSNPKGAITSEFDAGFPENVEIQVLEETANKIYVVLPQKPTVEGELSDAELEAVAGGKGGSRTGGGARTGSFRIGRMVGSTVSVGYCRGNR
ncbi:MAG: NHLP leader peptide family RiPP precursor [Xenococcaceae cyanobacterium]